MFDVSDDLLDILRSRSRDLLYLYEFYEYSYEPFPEPSDGNLSFDPRHAIALFAGQSVSFTWGDDTITYQREVLDGPSINKHKGKQFDTVTLKFSNVSRNIAAFVLNNKIQGMRLVVRVIPRSANSLSIVEASESPFTHSMILFVGRVNKPDNFNRSSGTISATQDLGTIEAQIPTRNYQQKCPLVNVFKKPGHDCMGHEALADKSPTYQAARSCNGSFAQCTDYSNTEFFQGTRIVQITSSFVHKANESFFKKVLNILPGIGRKKTVVGNSIHDGTPYGNPVPLIFGRWQKKLIPLQYKDTGETIWFKMAACRGTITDFLNIRNESANFSQPLNIVKHKGEYGGVGTQTADAVFPDASFHSKLAYITGSCIGSDIEVEDPAPDVSAMIVGQVVTNAFGTVNDGRAAVSSVFAGYGASATDYWSDNPVDLSRFVITEGALLGLPASYIAERATVRTSSYCIGPIKDLSNAERCLLPNTETARAGVDYKRFRSTGRINGLSFYYNNGVNVLTPAQRPGGVYLREADYEFFDPAAPPTSLDLVTVYRKRYTANIEINESKKAIDFLYDTLLPSFRGFLRWDHHGRIAIDCERPADHSFLRADAAAAATSVKVLDVTPWKPLEGISGEPSPLRGKVLIGAHKLTSEVRTISSANYSADGNAITLAASATGGLSASVSGAMLSGGSSSAAAEGRITISGDPVLGDTVTVTIDGFEIVLTVEAADTNTVIPDSLIVATRLVYMINAEPILRNYIVAERGPGTGFDTHVDIKCKYGVLNFTPALEENHYAELVDPTVAPTAATSAGALAEGTYLVAYAFRNVNGNTNISPMLSVTLADDEQIDVDAISPPAGADSIDWFVSVEPDSGTMLQVLNNDGSAFSINSLPATTEEQTPLRNTTGEETLRVMMSFAGKALAYADTTKANILDGSFSWPEGRRQSTINQVKGKYREAIQDFAEQALVVNDERHQERTQQTNSAELDISAVDNFNQASRLLNGYLAKLRDGDFFFKWGSAGEALLLEVGDVVCASDDSGAWRNVPIYIEDPSYTARFEINLTGRLYSTSMFDDAVIQTDVPLPSALINYLAGPPAPTALTLNSVETVGTFDSRITGSITPGDSIYGQRALVYVTPPGGTEVLAQTLAPGETEFSVPAPASGTYEIRVVAVSITGAVGGEISDTIDIVNGAESLFGAKYARLAFEFGDGKNATSLEADQTSRFPNLPAGEIIKSRIEGDTTGSAVVDIQTTTADPPSYASICASAKPTLSSDVFAEDTTLTGWTKTVVEGTKARAVLQSVSGLAQVTVVLTIER